MTSLKESQIVAGENVSENAETKKKNWDTFIATAASVAAILQAFLSIGPFDLYIASSKNNFYTIPVSRFYDQKNGSVIMMCLILIGFILVSVPPIIKNKEGKYLNGVVRIALFFPRLAILYFYFSFSAIFIAFLLMFNLQFVNQLSSVWIIALIIFGPATVYGIIYSFLFNRIVKESPQSSGSNSKDFRIYSVVIASIFIFGFIIPFLTDRSVEQKSSYEIMTPRNSSEQFAIIHNYSEDKALVVKARVSCDTCGHKTLLLENSQYFVTDISDATIESINFGSAKNIERRVKTDQ